MNEKKAIVFFFFVVFFCFSFLLLVVVVVTSTYVTYVFLSPSLSLLLCFVSVSVCSSSPPWRALTCVCFARLVYVCVCMRLCVFQFPLFAVVVVVFVVFFRGPHCASNAALLAHLVSSLTFVIRGGVFLHFFFSLLLLLVSNKTHTYRHGHSTHTDGRTDSGGGKSARAPLVLGSTHKTILRFFFIVVCYCYYYDCCCCCCCYSLLLLLLLCVINKQRKSALHSHTLS